MEEKRGKHVQLIKKENFGGLLIPKLSMGELQQKIDAAEKEKQNPFHEFNDVEILMWYIHEQKHADAKNDRSARTRKEYENELRLFIEHILQHGQEIGVDIEQIEKGSLFKSIEPRHFRRYQEWLTSASPYIQKGKIYSPATIARKTTILKSFFQYLYRVKYIQTDVAIGLRIATVRKDDRPDRDLGPGDVVKVLRAFQQIQHPVMFGIVLVLSTTGLRNEEFCQLKVGDVKSDRILGGHYLVVTGKGNKKRQIPLKEKVLESIRMFRQARELPQLSEADPTTPLFTTSRGTAFSPSYLISYVRKEFEKIKQELEGIEVKLTPHVFRHAFAITSRLNKADAYDIMRSLGHEKLETTQIYLEKVFAREGHVINNWSSNTLDEFL
ncbi:integrase family protein [Planococcus antarcticus DSM 14505]|uniref:Integrase family protein n=1 Tax=Planococcus antarcticus DSM 14505 TaxID=1185653 RepID=A0AA87IHG0_9BACL|nr:tyrosine-type recombinase/integrase [Planococcus antarcticus]EIM04956.1 integrase family protein [Planococcus antarcticus DSM 14505]